MSKLRDFFQLYLRIALSAGYLTAGLDRLGFWGKFGQKYVSWGDWQHFMLYAREVMSFLPARVAAVLAVLATVGEIGFGLLLLIGKWTRFAALGSGILALLFALSMAISQGLVQPLSYSVFTVSAASLVLAVQPRFRWSWDDGFQSGTSKSEPTKISL
jgi:putative oxidoreductase